MSLRSSGLQPEQLLRIAVRDALLVRGTDRDLLQEGAGLHHRAVGVVDREHDALGADFEQQAEERRREIEAAEGVVHVLPQVIAERALQLGQRRLKIAVEPRQHEGQAFAQMADHDLQFRIAVEHAAQDQAKNVNGGLDVPAPARGREHPAHFRREAGILRLDHRLRRPRRVHVDRHVERLGALEDRPEEFVVHVAAADVAVDQRAAKAELAHAALQLGCGLVRHHGRQRGEPGEALGMFLHGSAKKLIGVARQRQRFRRVQLLGARRVDRQHLHVDAG